jgi:GntR family transcriptional regulator
VIVAGYGLLYPPAQVCSAVGVDGDGRAGRSSDGWLLRFHLDHVSVDYDSPIPPHRQVAEFIRARIRSGELQAGNRVPGVTGMMQEFGIARTTAGKVLALLREKGLITVTPGWVSFVSQNPTAES